VVAKRRAVLRANAANASSEKSRLKAEQTKKVRRAMNQHLEQSQKRSRRSGVDYQAGVTKGLIVSILLISLI
jgi:hypothetical protein